MSIGWRLVALLAVPLLAVLVLAGIGVFTGMGQANDAGRLRNDTAVALASYSLIESLEAERSAMVSNGVSDPSLRDAVAADAESLRLAADDASPEVAERTTSVLERVEQLGVVPRRELSGDLSMKSYSAAVRQLLDLSADALDPRGTIDAGAANAVQYLARAQSAAAQEYDLATSVTAEITNDDVEQIMLLASEQQSYSDLAAAAASPGLASDIREVAVSLNAADLARRSLLDDDTGSTVEVWRTNLAERVAEYTELRDAAAQEALDAVSGMERNARLLLTAAIAVAVLILVATLFLLRWARRSIGRPLRELAEQAEEVARHGLPAAVAAQQEPAAGTVRLPALRASGAMEVDEVAMAFNEVQDTALKLAGEQAALRVNQAEALTNLARRNQTLLARQLDFISTLEERETDPGFLQHLFRLDHLASRMRRNAESLLILAGSETPRRRRKPADVTEVVRAAMGEVEEFERVRIGHLRSATITGPAVIDLVHLLAELMENALAFSPPDVTVEIDGRGMVQGGYQFAIIDHGVGMSDVELVAANHRLSGQDEINGMPTRFLGQYVVAKLAQKIGAMVRLQLSTGGRGVTAVVVLSADSVVGGEDRSTAAAPLPGSAAARALGPTPFAPGTAVPVEPGSELDLAEIAEAVTPEPADARGSAEVDLPAPPDHIDLSVLDDRSVDSGPESTTPLPLGAEPIEPVMEPVELTFEPAEPVFETVEPVIEPIDPVELGFDQAEVVGTPPPFDVPADPATLEDAGEPDLTWSDPIPSASDVRGGTSGLWERFLAADETDPAHPDEPQSFESQSFESQSFEPEAPEVWATQPVSEPAMDPTRTPEPAELLNSGPRTGGLARRVPGQSLADRSRSAQPAEPAAASRSADGVRSMLSSLQAGRTRGRTDAPDSADLDHPPVSSDLVNPFTNHNNAEQGGRSSQ